jgi:hypothetical protein
LSIEVNGITYVAIRVDSGPPSATSIVPPFGCLLRVSFIQDIGQVDKTHSNERDIACTLLADTAPVCGTTSTTVYGISGDCGQAIIEEL